MMEEDNLYPADMPLGGQDMLMAGSTGGSDPAQLQDNIDGDMLASEPLPPILTIEEIAERTKLISWLKIGKTEFRDIYDSLGVTDELVAAYNVEQLKMLQLEFKKVRDFRNSYSKFLDLAKRASYLTELMLCGFGIDMTGLHERLSANPSYLESLKAVVHDHCTVTVSPVTQLAIAVLYTGAETYAANINKKAVGSTTADDSLINSLEL